jgi:hypothetical protein
MRTGSNKRLLIEIPFIAMREIKTWTCRRIIRSGWWIGGGKLNDPAKTPRDVENDQGAMKFERRERCPSLSALWRIDHLAVAVG